MGVIIPTPTDTPTITPTGSPTPTPMPLGQIVGDGPSKPVYDSPNGRVRASIAMDTIAMIVEIRTTGGQSWYLLRWEESGLVQEGWVSGNNIELIEYP